MSREMYQVSIFENENGDISIQQEDVVQQEHKTVVIALEQVEIVCDWIAQTKAEMSLHENEGAK